MSRTSLLAIGFASMLAMLLMIGCHQSSIPHFQEDTQKHLVLREPVTQVEFSNNGEHLAVVTLKGIHVYKAGMLSEIWDIQEPTNSVAFSPDGTLLGYSLSNNQIVLAQANTGEVFQTITSGLEEATWIDNLTFSPDGTLLVATVRVVSETTSSSIAIIWNIQSGERLLTLRPEEVASAPETMSWAFMNTEFSPDGNTLATGLFGSQVILWNAQTGERLRDLQDLENAFGTVDDLDWNPDGSLLATGHRGGIVAIWNPDNGKLLHSFQSDALYAYRVKWSPDGSYLAAGLSLIDTSVARILIFDVEGNLLDTLETHDESVSTIAWSPDGQNLVIDSSNEVLFWTVQ